MTGFELSDENQVRAAERLGISRNAMRTHLANLGVIAGRAPRKAPAPRPRRPSPGTAHPPMRRAARPEPGRGSASAREIGRDPLRHGRALLADVGHGGDLHERPAPIGPRRVEALARPAGPAERLALRGDVDAAPEPVGPHQALRHQRRERRLDRIDRDPAGAGTVDHPVEGDEFDGAPAAGLEPDGHPARRRA